jgi:sulfur carrier protein
VGEGLSAAPGGAPRGARQGKRQGSAGSVRVTIGGQPREVTAGTTVAQLLASLGAAGRPCAVEINRTIVPRAAHADHRLAEGDAIEIVGFVGGG